MLRRWGVVAVLGLGVATPGFAASASAARRAAPAAATAGDRLVIPSIRLDKALVVGWTREINQGKIVLIGGCWPGTPKTPEPPCSTTWVAGHHTTHGSPFRNLPNVRVGSLVTLNHDGQVSTYKIYSKITVKRATPPTWVFQQDIMIQCSNGATGAWVLNGRLVSTRPA